jgi:AsmA protein
VSVSRLKVRAPAGKIGSIGLKRFVLLVAIAVAAGAAAIVAARHVIPVDTVSNAVTSEIRAVTGLDPVLRGPIAMSVFPARTVTFSDVVLGESAAGQPAVAVEELIANLRLMPLLMGRIEISDITLIKPRIALEIGPDGHTNWSPLIDTLARALQPDAHHDDRVLSFSEIRINDGVIAVRDPSGGLDETLERVEVSLAWPSIAKSFGATGHFSWHNENVEASVSMTDFPAALAGRNSGFKFRFNAAPLKAAFDGAMRYAPSLKVDGTLAADAMSLREALRWTGDTTLPDGGLGRFALKARTAVGDGTISLSNLNAEFDGNVAEGVITYTTAGRRLVQGTLAVERLDLTPYVSTVRLLAENTREWDRTPIALDWFNGWDADLRLSAARVRMAHAQLGRTAVAATMRGGRLVVTIGESQSFNGLITGTIALAKTDTGADFKTQMQFADIDLEKAMAEVFRIRRAEGTGNISLELESTGASVQELARNLDGSAQISAKDGALTGVNVEQLLRRLALRPLSGGGDFRNGRTPFDRLNIALQIVQGTATIEDVHVDGPNVKLGLTGTTSIPAREFDLSGTAALTNANADPNSFAFELPFVVQGPWDDPVMLPDAQTLIRRSGASAPLLDAVRDRKTRDAVDSIMRRLTGPAPGQR